MSFGTGFGTPGGFGAPQQAPSASNLQFGAPQAQTQTPGFSFGAPAANPTPGLFGTPQQAPQQATSFGFSTPASNAVPNADFANAYRPAGAVQAPVAGFGTQAQQQTATPAPAFGTAFGTPSAAPAATSMAGFGTLGGNTGGGLSFGTPQNQTQPKLGGLSFGAPAAATAAPIASQLSFGAPAAQSASNLGGGFQLGGSTAPTLGLSFGAPPPTVTAAGLNFGTTSTASTGLSFGLGTTSTPSTGLSFGFGGGAAPLTQSTASATVPAPVGLGGIASSTPSSAATMAKTEQAPKEQLLPNEIQQTVDNFKSFVKQQKSYSSDVARCSVKEFRKVETDIDGLNNLLNEVEKQLQLNRNIAEKLKYDTAKGLQQVEMAQRTYDTPIGLQYENTAPMHYFIELSDQFEREMQNMRLQIENTDKYIKDNGKSAPLTHQDLVMGMRRIHEIFVSLAGHLQALHTQVESQKEQYLNFRKYMLNDSTNVFDSNNKETENTINQIRSFTLRQPPMLASGPTPFGNVTHPSVVQAAAQNNPPPTFQSATNTFGGFGSAFPASNSSLFGNTSSFGAPAFGLGSSSGFQLQKPPTGNKRGKQ